MAFETPMDVTPDNPDAEIPQEPEEKELISDDDALKLVNDTYQKYDYGRRPFERQWYRNILFLLGNQWIIWDRKENRWRNKRLADWVPTPVTNKFASAGERLVSVLSRIEPNWEYVPESGSEDDIRTAQQCSKAEDVIAEENHIEDLRARIAPWLIYTGNCYLLSGVEPKTMDVPNPLAPEEMMSQTFDHKLYTDVLSPFEVWKDFTIEKFEEQQKLLVVNRRDKEYVKNMWEVDVEGDDLTTGFNYQESIGFVTSSPEITEFLTSLKQTKRALVKRLYARPTKEYPDGLYIVVAGNKVVEKTTLPKTAQGEAFVPLAHIKFDAVPGASNGRTPMDDLVYKQIQRNKIESLIELIALRMASPVWLMPEGTTMRNISTAPGAIVKYSSIGDKMGKPDRIPGEQIPASIMQFMERIDKDIEDLVSTFEALKGQAPYSGAPGVVIEQLIEQGLTRFGPALRNMAEGWRQWMKHQLELYRAYGWAPRVMMKRGEQSQWVEEKFNAADLSGAVNVKIESDSTIPRSSQVEVAKILSVMDKPGLLDMSNPVLKQKVFRKLHMQDLYDDLEADRLAAVKENEAITQGQQVQVVPFIDNHLIHIYEHKQLYYSDQGQEFRDFIAKHIAEHNMTMDAEMNSGAPPVPSPPGGGRGSSNMSDKDKKAIAPGGNMPSLPNIGVQ